ncbi:Glycosyltransferase involved in cell wall bisynthesis [Methylobacterium phyllostachyos]|uniref:Glycosyltransferase involved in cell wall bisynthesis n=1 Tax=Methylobacterium phyllostachyos TaxID=582672 RepID=A0A1H0C3B5_9HYPH|nr:glycosyltransferase [Methylobacterium phyllostachyos]SDN52365.1 Glycosyltransferase involved in cell wall bisynthesis [Methylobacterium phyllostachyos]
MDLSIAVVIPLYNHEGYIEPAIESVLSQTRPADEIVIIDDGSQDGGYDVAVALLRGYPGSRVLRQANAGAHVTLNRAIQLATTTHIAVLNSDDLFLPNKLERCAELFGRYAEADLLFGGVDLVDGSGANVENGVTADWLARCRVLLERTGNLTLALYQENLAVTTSNFVFNKRFWARQGGFQALRYCHDLDFILAALNRGHVIFDRERTHIRYRVHESNTIKESLDAINAEIAAVLACNLRELPVTPACISQAELKEAIAYRGIADQILSLMPLHRQAPDRPAFYRLALTPGYSQRGTSRTIVNEATSEAAKGLPLPAIIVTGAKAEPTSRPPHILAHSCVNPVVAIEVGSFDKGGLEKVVLDLAISLRRRGFCPLVVSVGKVGFLGDQAIAAGIEVVQLPSTAPLPFYEALLRARQAQLSISHFSRVGYPAFAALGIPNITFIHNVYAMLTGEAVANFIADARYVDRFISVSDKATEYAIGRLGIDAGKIVTIPNGIIVPELARRERIAPQLNRSEFGLAEDDYVFINVASYNLHKAHYLMAEALKIARRQRPEIKILCIGNEIYPPHVGELRAFLEREGLSQHMLMPGFQKEVASAFRIADAFLLPSFIEGWSIAMNEAMYFGKPMILSDTGGSSAVIEESDTGILVPNEYGRSIDLDSQLLDELAYSPRAYKTAPILASAMVRFASEPDHWRDAGARGREKVLTRYNFEDVMDRYEEVIRHCFRSGITTSSQIGGPTC